MRTGNLPYKDTFYQRTYLTKDDKMYTYGYEHDVAYIYSIPERTWYKKN